MSNNIGVSRRQTVFVVKEDTKGTLKWPSATDLILPAGDAVMNQNPTFEDSMEKRDTLDVLDQFQNSKPAGTWNIPLYCRPSGTLGNAPQADALFESLQGVKNPATTAPVATAINSTIATLGIGTVVGGAMPARGVIQIGTELIHYSGKSGSNLTGLTRGYNSTTAASHATAATITLKSVVYRQATTSPSVSIWIKSDHFIQAMAGCSVDQAQLNVDNSGAVDFAFNGMGMIMTWAGTDDLSAAHATSATLINVTDAKKYSVGMRIQNVTAEDTNGGDGYVIKAVNVTNNTLRLSEGIDGTWASGDVISGYLPTGTETGEPLESRRTSIELDGVSAKFRTSTLTIGTPKQYIEDEVGTEYPEDYVEQTRNITQPLNLYFRRDEAKRFHDGFQGSEIPIEMVFGNTVGKKMAIYAPKAKVQVPTINFEDPTVAISMDMRMLGTSGEDSLEIRFE